MQSISSANRRAVRRSGVQRKSSLSIRPANRLPQPLTSFLGRERELETLSAMLGDPGIRLVTLTGPGGVGKTRLAIATARRTAAYTTSSVAFIALASLADPALLPSTIGTAFGFRENDDRLLAERLALALGGDPLLLVLDNFEHLIDRAPLVSELLQWCPALTILVTSRRTLQLSSEVEHSVRPLATPQANDSLEVMEQTAAFRLFAERSPILFANPNAQGNCEDIEAIGEICRRLDGIPLAIELAAARMRLFRPAELLVRLDQRLPLLVHGPRDAPPRLRSMSDAIGWSYDLLSADEQALFRQLSVFEGGFSLEAAEAMAPADCTLPLELVGALADHSLIQRQESEYGPRFIMLETIREFGLAKLAERDETAAARDRHASWLAGRIGPAFTMQGRARIDRQQLQLPGDHENLRSAIKWTVERDRPEQAADLAMALWPFWNRTASHHEAVMTWEMILGRCQACPEEKRAALASKIGSSSYINGDFERARHFATQGLGMFKMLGSQLGVTECLSLLGLIARWSDPAASIEYFTDALAIATDLGGRPELEEAIEFNLSQCALSMIHVGELARARDYAQEALDRLQSTADGAFNRPISIGAIGWISGLEADLDTAAACGQEQLALSERSSVMEGRWYAYRILGEIAVARGDMPLALKHFQRSLEIIQECGSFTHWRGLVLAELAMTAFELGDRDRAAGLWGAASTIFDRLQFAESTKRYATSWTGRYEMPAELAVDEQATAAYKQGRGLSDPQSFALAMAVVADRPGHDRGNRLTRRQLDVLKLMSQGCTNREIAGQLFISPRTVDRHISSIFNVLGAPNRTSAVAMARERDLLDES